MKHGLILYLAVGVAGFVGAISRLFISTTSPRFFGPDFPFGTLIINVTGSFIFGWFWQLTSPAGRWSVSDTVRMTVLVGFVGSYTTFSTYVFDSHQFLEQGSWLKAGANLIGSLILGLLAIQLGMRVAGR